MWVYSTYSGGFFGCLTYLGTTEGFRKPKVDPGSLSIAIFSIRYWSEDGYTLSRVAIAWYTEILTEREKAQVSSIFEQKEQIVSWPFF